MKSDSIPHTRDTSTPPQWPFKPDKLSDAELLSSLFRGCHQPAEVAVNSGMSATITDVRACQELLVLFGGLRSLGIASRKPPDDRDGLHDSRAKMLLLAVELVRRQLQQNLERGTSLTSPATTMEYLQTILRDRSREIFTCLFLDTRHRVIAVEDLFQGSIDGACVYPRIVAERALRLSAAAVIVAHNHPSGISEPSLADQAITRRLKDALLLLEIRLLDHFVVGDGMPVSMASRGML